MVESGGRRVTFVVIDHHGAPPISNSKIPTAAEIAKASVREGTFRDPKFILEFFDAVALHDVGLSATLNESQRRLVGNFITRYLFYKNKPIDKADVEATVAPAFRGLTLSDFQRLQSPLWTSL